MLYICIFSNKFDLIQAIRVSHRQTSRKSEVDALRKVDRKVLDNWRLKKNFFPLCFFKKG